MILAAVSSDAVVGLVGVAVGWLLGFGSDSIRAELRGRSERRKAAQLIYGELTTNLGAVSALRKYGVWADERIHRSAWDAHGSAFLHRGNIERVGRLSQAYASMEDIGFMAQEEDRDFTKGHGAEFLSDVLIPFIYAAMREAGKLAGLSEEEAERRIEESRRLTHEPG